MKFDQIKSILRSFGVSPYKKGNSYRLNNYDGQDGSDQREVDFATARGKDVGLIITYPNGYVGANDENYTLGELRAFAKILNHNYCMGAL